MYVGEWSYDGIKFEGLSLAGVRTSLTIPELSVSFDVAQGLPHTLGMKHFLITHGHLDHSAGIPYIISQKAMNTQAAPKFYMHESLVKPLTEIMKLWAQIEDHEYKFEFHAVEPGQDVEIKPKIFARPFRTVHRVPSFGYSIIRKVRKLKRELEGKTQSEIVELRRKGIDPTDEFEELLVSFTGDTKIEFLDLNPQLLSSKILIVEATYLDEKKSVESAREWGHIHFDELISRLDSIKSERIVIIHTSSRYSFKEAKALIETRVPEAHRERVVLFPGR